MTDDKILDAIAERMNRLEEVAWDRCVVRDNHAGVYGWIARDDVLFDFVFLEFQWGDTTGVDGKAVTWFGVAFATSSALHSASIQARLLGEDTEHIDCQRVEHVLAGRVNNAIELDHEQHTP